MNKDKRPLGGIIEDHYLGIQGVYTGGLANDIGLQEHKRKQHNNSNFTINSNSTNIPKTYTSQESKPLTKYEFENRIAGLICLALLGVIIYFGLTEYKLQWYLPLGVGGVSALVIYKILTGPLRIFLRLIRWALIIGFFAGLGYGILHLFNVI